MNHAHTFGCLISGTAHYETPVDEAVAERFEEIREMAMIQVELPEACYDGERTKPQNLGWRFAQGLRMAGRGLPSEEAILTGEFDDEIVDTYHEAARAEHWYRHEKDWGWT